MSRAPYLLPGARWGERLGHGKVLDHMIHEGLTDAFHDIHMGITAENLVERVRHQPRGAGRLRRARARRARRRRSREGRFKDGDRPRARRAEEGRAEAVRHRRASRAPAPPPSRSAKLKPAFKKDGTVTAGNASGINDGAAALVVASRRSARSGLGAQAAGADRLLRLGGRRPEGHGHRPGARGAQGAGEGRRSPSTHIDLFELNEAFAAQSLAVLRELGARPGEGQRQRRRHRPRAIPSAPPARASW